MNYEMPNTNYKTIFSLRVRQELKKYGFEPLLEKDNALKPEFKCWVYERTEEFDNILSIIMNRKETYHG